MSALVKRNLKLFFRDKTSVFFSLLSVLIILGLYILFLGDVTSNDIPIESARTFVDIWMIAGIMAVSSLTSTLGALGVVVMDKESRRFLDFRVSPLSNRKLMLSYLFSAIIVGVLMSVIVFIVASLYLYLRAGLVFELLINIKILCVILLAVSSSASLIFFFISFISSQNAYSTVSIVIGTVVGFLTGIYVPIGALPSFVQLLIKIFPVSHSALLFKQIMLKETLNEIPAQVVHELEQTFGVVYTLGDTTLNMTHSIVYLLVCCILFGLLTVWSLSRKK